MLYNSNSWLTVVEPYLQLLKRLVFRGQNVGEMKRDEIARKYDGENNPLGKAYTSAEIRAMLSGLSDVRLRHGTPRLNRGRSFIGLYEQVLERSGINSRFGFWSIATAHKP